MRIYILFFSFSFFYCRLPCHKSFSVQNDGVMMYMWQENTLTLTIAIRIPFCFKFAYDLKRQSSVITAFTYVQRKSRPGGFKLPQGWGDVLRQSFLHENYADPSPSLHTRHQREAERERELSSTCSWMTSSLMWLISINESQMELLLEPLLTLLTHSIDPSLQSPDHLVPLGVSSGICARLDPLLSAFHDHKASEVQ